MRTLLSWSTGKDAAWALHRLRQTPGVEVVGLFTTINEAFDRVPMHDTRRELAEAQAAAAGLRLHAIWVPSPCSDAAYAQRMSAFLAKARADHVEAIAFGDLFLEDIRAYREERLRESGIKAHFPLWGIDTRQLAREMIEGGLKARLVSVDPREIIGGEFDAPLLASLPPTVDPCGENGEFHTFAYAGPMFDAPIPITSGPVVERDGFLYAELSRAS